MRNVTLVHTFSTLLTLYCGLLLLHYAVCMGQFDTGSVLEYNHTANTTTLSQRSRCGWDIYGVGMGGMRDGMGDGRACVIQASS